MLELDGDRRTEVEPSAKAKFRGLLINHPAFERTLGTEGGKFEEWIEYIELYIAY